MPVGCFGLCALKLVLGGRYQGSEKNKHTLPAKNTPHVVDVNKTGRKDPVNKFRVSV